MSPDYSTYGRSYANIRKCSQKWMSDNRTYRSRRLIYPFKYFQFPIRMVFAMTTNKSQGQTMTISGLDLETSCSSHGQLYVVCPCLINPFRCSRRDMSSLVVRASDSRPEVLVPCLNCGGGDWWCRHLSSLWDFRRAKQHFHLRGAQGNGQ
ncbi:hypothetical protein TNCV_3674191 [Trichonephila clavipes]|nr:hypothetical protein TNCV_3674191 [Trichonephila clavipes]